MKRVILGTLSSVDPYVRVPLNHVVDQLIECGCKTYNVDALTSSQKIRIRRAILSWKRMNNVIFHHKDTNTYNNTPENIILFTKSAHGYLHSYTTQIVLRDVFGLLTPGYPAGKLAKKCDIEVLNKLGEVLDFKQYDANQFIDAIFTSDVIDVISSIDNLDLLESEVAERLYQIEPNVVKKADIERIVKDYLRSIDVDNPSIDVDYIDDDVAYTLLGLIDELYAQYDEPLNIKSLDVVKSFIRNNKRSKYDICKDRYGKDNVVEEDISD